MLQRSLALLLCLALTITPALAAVVPGETVQYSSESAVSEETAAVDTARELLFPKVTSYTGFSDVSASHWALSCIKLCCETGLMQGQGSGRFSPGVSISNSELAVLAARIHAAINGGSFESDTTPWYQGAVSYLHSNGIPVGSPNANATRLSFFQMLAAILPASMLTPINSISLLPDTRDPTVLSFYNAGILTGVDKYGTFNGSATLTRAECAAMVARIVDPSLRQRFAPAGQTPAAPFEDSAVVVTVNGSSVTFDHFLEVMLSLIDETQTLYLNYGLVFSWDDSYGMESWSQFFREATLHSVAAEVLAEQKAAQLGCSMEMLAFTLFGAPTQAELEACAIEHDIPALPDYTQLLTELVLEEKLSNSLSVWVAEASIVTTAVYDQIDSQELWELYG